MGDVVSLAEYRQKHLGERALTMRKMLVAEFERAAYCLTTPDFVSLARSDTYARENYTYDHVQKLIEPVRRTHPESDLFAVEIEATKDVSRILGELCEDVRDGASLPVIRRAWQRALGGMAETLADTAWPIIAGTRSSRTGAPNPRSG